METKNILILVAIILVALFFRLYALQNIPVSLNWDEASIGYNAYSILETGKDEYGVKLPLFLRSFGNFKSAIPSYLSIPLINFFGLNELTVRLPTAILATLSILACFFLVKNLTNNVKLGLISAFLLSISPWHLHFSRFCCEGMIALSFMLWGMVFLFNKKKDIPKTILASLFFALSFYTYDSVKLFLLFFISIYFIIERKKYFKKNRKNLILFFILLLVFLLPFLVNTMQAKLFVRAQEVSILAHQEYIDEIMQGFFKYEKLNIPFKRVFNNKVVFFGYLLIKKYLEHFSMDFLFLGKEISPRLGLEFLGKLYPVELPFLIYGLYRLALAKNKKIFLILSSWLLLAPLASTLTFDSPHSLRSLVFLPSFQIISAYGFLSFYKQIKKKKGVVVSKVFSFFTFFLLILSFGYYLNFYYLYYPEHSAAAWQDGSKEMAKHLFLEKDKFDKIIVSIHSGEPHIFFAFWNKIPPQEYQKERKKDINSHDFNQFENIHFKWVKNEDLCLENSLIIAPPPPGMLRKLAEPKKIIYLTNRFKEPTAIFDIIETEPFRFSEAYLEVCAKNND